MHPRANASSPPGDARNQDFIHRPEIWMLRLLIDLLEKPFGKIISYFAYFVFSDDGTIHFISNCGSIIVCLQSQYNVEIYIGALGNSSKFKLQGLNGKRQK